MIGKIRIKVCLASILLAIGVLGDTMSVSAVHGGGYAITDQMQNSGYMAVLYNSFNGLPTSEANCILGASDGYVWIGGYSGIIKYDGSTFERLPSSTGLTNGRGMFEDSRGRIWVATNDNGIVVIDNGEYLHYSKGQGLTSASIRSFAEDAEGIVYIGSTAGVSYMDNGMSLHLVNDSRINSERVLRLVSDKDGTVYGHTKSGSVFSIENGKVTAFYDGESLRTGKITTILADPKKDGWVYLGTEDGRIYYGEFGTVSDKMQVIKAYPMTNIHWMSYECGRVWASSDSMIGYLDVDDHFKLITNLPVNTSIEMMTSDYQGNMWFASSRQGVMKVVPNQFENFTYNSGIRKGS